MSSLSRDAQSQAERTEAREEARQQQQRILGLEREVEEAAEVVERLHFIVQRQQAPFP